MLQNTFLQVPGVGPSVEQRIWRAGFLTWDDVLNKNPNGELPASLSNRLRRYVSDSEEAYNDRNARFFSERLPKPFWWRMLPEFLDSTVFLDIETTGLSRFYDQITLVGVSDTTEPRVFVRGSNLDKFARALEGAGLMVTFNGSLFDIPFIKASFPNLILPPVHIDLRFLLRKVGLSGGLKSIETQVGIQRDRDLTELDGASIPSLWFRYCRGDMEALRTIARYNIEDVANMALLLAFAWWRLRGEAFQTLRRQGVQTKLNAKLADLKLSRKEHLLKTSFPSPWEAVPGKPPVGVSRQGDKNRRLQIGQHQSLSLGSVGARSVDLKSVLAKIPRDPPVVVGIDLSGSSRRRTGWAVMQGGDATTALASTDEEIMGLTNRKSPDLISIDSPLGLPSGRDCTRPDCACAVHGIMRQAERILKKRGINVYPSLLPSMRQLTERGIRLAQAFRERGFEVIESYPGAAQDILRIARKKVSVEELEFGLLDFGVSLHKPMDRALVHDELDAVTSAIVGYFYIAGLHEALGPPEEGPLIVPRL